MEIMTRCEKNEKKHKTQNGNHDEMRRMLRRDTKHRMEMLTRCGNGEKEHRIRDGNNEDMWETWKQRWRGILRRIPDEPL